MTKLIQSVMSYDWYIKSFNFSFINLVKATKVEYFINVDYIVNCSIIPSHVLDDLKIVSIKEINFYAFASRKSKWNRLRLLSIAQSEFFSLHPNPSSSDIKSVETSFVLKLFLTETSTIFHWVAGFIVSTRKFPWEIIRCETSERNLNGLLVELLKYSAQKISSNSFSLMNVYAFVMERRKISDNQCLHIFSLSIGKLLVYFTENSAGK